MLSLRPSVKYFSIMNRVFRHSIALCFACAMAYAQDVALPVSSGLDEYMETGMEVSGVRAPYYDEDGNLQAELYGGHAKVLEGGVVDVTNLRIDVYDEGAVAMTIFAPQCFSQVDEKGKEQVLSVESAGDVLITMEQMTIIGHGFRFSSDSNRFEILSEAKVLVNESARNVEGLEL